jgi:hypothetical protein
MNYSDLRDLMTRLGVRTVRRSGPRHIAIQCLFAEWRHEHGADNRPSMTVSINPNGESWLKCHACEYKKPLLSAIRELSAKSAFGRLAEIREWVEKNEGRDFSVEADDGWKEDVFDYTDEARRLLKIPLPKKALEFLATKGITDPTIIRDYVLWDPEQRAVVIPTLSMQKNRLTIVGAAARRLEKGGQKYWTIWEYEPYFHLYGEHLLSRYEGKVILIVEGQFDALHCWQLGIPAVALMGVNYGIPKGELLRQAKIKAAALLLDPDVYSTPHRKAMVIDSARKALLELGIPTIDEKLEKDPKYLDAQFLQGIIKKASNAAI